MPLADQLAAHLNAVWRFSPAARKGLLGLLTETAFECPPDLADSPLVTVAPDGRRVTLLGILNGACIAEDGRAVALVTVGYDHTPAGFTVVTPRLVEPPAPTSPTDHAPE